MIARILSILSGAADFASLAKRALDMADQFKRWLFIQERTGAFDKAETAVKETHGNTEDLEALFKDPNRDS